MLLTFLRHQWLGFWRSKGKGREFGIKLFMAFLILYLAATGLVIGFNMEGLILELFPDKSVFLVFNGLVLYYFTLDFLFRFQLQELPALAIVPYLHLPVSKTKILQFLQLKPLFSIFNLIPFLIFAPFILTGIREISDINATIMYLFAILCLVLWNNYAVLYAKRIATGRLTFMVTGFTLAVAAASLEYLGIFKLSALSDTLFKQILDTPWIALYFVLPTALIIWVNNSYLRKHLYIEEITQKNTAFQRFTFDLPEAFGIPGKLAALELKLIPRNKRPRATVSKSLLFLFYGLIFYTPKALNNNEFGLLLFAAVFMTGNISLIYGQFMFGWQSAEFNGLLTSKMTIRDFFRAKLLLMTSWTVAFTLILSPYGLLSPKILLLHLVTCLYHLGIGNVVILYFATLNYKHIDLSKSSSMSWQGVSTSTILLTLPLIILPIVIYFLFSWILSPYPALFLLGAAGLAAFFLQGKALKILHRAFIQRKYQITEGFRQNS